MSVLQSLFRRAGRPIPTALRDWDDRVARWHEDYLAGYLHAELSEINLDLAVFVFDHAFERVTLAYAISDEQLVSRDRNRMRGFPSATASVDAALGGDGFVADKGHFLGHASGGVLDINLFPHRRDLNRGNSPEGKRFRGMERYVAERPGTFFYHRPLYVDDTWIPESLEYGVLADDERWWAETFRNR
jgi:hypothetical protein